MTSLRRFLAIITEAFGFNRAAWKATIDSLPETTLFQVFFKLVMMLLVVKGAGWAADAVFALQGASVVVNEDLFRQIWNPAGVAAIFILVTAFLMTFTTEGTGLKRICCHYQLGRDLPLMKALVETYRRPSYDGIRYAFGQFWRIVVAILASLVIDLLLPNDSFWDIAVLTVVLTAAAIEYLRYQVTHILVGYYCYADNNTVRRAFRRRAGARAWWRRAAALVMYLLTVLAATAGLGYGGYHLLGGIVRLVDDLPAQAFLLTLGGTLGTVLITLFWCSASALKANLLVVIYCAERERTDDLFLTDPPRKPRQGWNQLRRRAGAVTFGFLALLLAATFWFMPFFERQIADLERETRVLSRQMAQSDTSPAELMTAYQRSVLEGADCVMVSVHQVADTLVILPDTRAWHFFFFLQYDLGSKPVFEVYSDEFRNTSASAGTVRRLLPLAEVIDWAKRNQAELAIVLNPDSAAVDLDSRIVALLRAKQYCESGVIMAKSVDLLRRIKRLEPRLRTGAILHATFGDLKKLEADFHCLPLDQAKADQIDAAHREGRRVLVFDVESDREGQFLDYGVDGVITDSPPVIRNLVERKQRRPRHEKLFALIMHDLGF